MKYPSKFLPHNFLIFRTMLYYVVLDSNVVHCYFLIVILYIKYKKTLKLDLNYFVHVSVGN